MNWQISLVDVVRKMEETLSYIDYDYKEVIKNLGQVETSARRERGEEFKINDHVKGMVLSLLSNQRPWKPIMQNMDRISEIFLNFQIDEIKKANKSSLAEQLKKIKCGNRAIDKQMACLDFNLSIFEQIEIEYGSLDRFVLSDSPDKIAWELGHGHKFKLKQIGFTLALEYLRNVGIQTIKPDVHIRRIISEERLNLYPGYPTEIQTLKILSAIAEEAKVSLTYMDNLMWLYCAIDYANICGSNPKCNICKLQTYCNKSINSY